MTISEYDFASTFLSLLSDSPIVVPDSHKEDLNSVESLIKLPELPIAKSSSTSHNSNEKRTIKAHFKSIKPPKFGKELDLDLNDSVFRVKVSLIADTKELEGYGASQLKFLIKGKVIQDSTLVGTVAGGTDEEIKFTVMVSGKPAEIAPEDEKNDVVMEDAVVQVPWNQIRDVLQNSAVADVDAVLERLQKGWELTK